jgi:uncharacterized protein YeaO (DUF488 family)
MLAHSRRNYTRSTGHDCRTPARGRAGRRDIRIKRIYDAAKPSDGFRALVDRLWPRGISKRHAALQSLRQRAARQRVTLLYGARDPLRNHALVLRDVLRKS